MSQKQCVDATLDIGPVHQAESVHCDGEEGRLRGDLRPDVFEG